MTNLRYDYKCVRCGFVKEFMEPRDMWPQRPCDAAECKGIMRRLPSAVGVVYKSGGFYSVDHRKGGSQ